MMLRTILLVALAAAGFAIPLIRAIRELVAPQDDVPLGIDATYTREDRFFALSFARRLETAAGPSPRPPGRRTIQLRRPTQLETVAGAFHVPAGFVQEGILEVQGSIVVASGASLASEVVATEDATLADGSQAHALKCEGDLMLQRNVRVDRWIDAGGTIRVGDGSDLGARATAGGEIHLGNGVSFQLLAATRIAVEPAPARDEPPPNAPFPSSKPVGEYRTEGARTRADGALVVQGDFTLPAGAIARGDLIATGSITIAPGAVLDGSLHADGDVELGNGSRVIGSAISDARLMMGRGARVGAHVVAATEAVVHEGASIGTPGRITTLLAGRSIRLHPGAIVYGRVVTNGSGLTVRS